MELIKLLAELNENFDLTGFYSINLWPSSGEVTLQGRFTTANAKLAETMDMKMSFKDGYLQGVSVSGQVKIILTPQ